MGAGVSVLQDQSSTSKESIGWLVWAPFLPEHPTIRWPSEAVDPLHPPKGRTVPEEAYKGLSLEDRDSIKHSMQQLARTAHATGAPAVGASIDVESIEAQQLKEALVASVAEASNHVGCEGGPPENVRDGLDAPEEPHARTANAAASNGAKVKSKGGRGVSVVRRVQPVRDATPTKVLVNLFGTHKLLWMSRSQLLDFDEHRQCGPPM